MKDERYLTLKEATALLPGTPHISTVVRWHLNGIRGKKLRTAKVGGRRYTTELWLQEFVEACSMAPLERRSAPTLSSLREKHIQAAERDLFGEALDPG